MNTDRDKALDMALAQIDKQFGKGAIMKMGERTNMNIEAMSTGALALDLALGIGGLPRGRITEIYGPESSGKSTLAMHVVAEAQRNGGVCAYIDAEHAMDPIYARAIGVDVDQLLISQPDTGEQALEIADMLCRSGAIDVIVVDSVAALTPRAEIEGEMGDTHVGLQARLMSQALRKLTGNISKTNTIIIFINQLREKIGVMFGSPETTPGGRALKFYSSVRLDIRRIESLKDGAEVVGNRTRVKVVKNKVSPPFRQAEFDIMYGQGISREGSLIDLSVDLGIVKKSGAWFTYEGEQLGQGRENAKTYLKQNPEVMMEISDKVLIAAGLKRGRGCGRRGVHRGRRGPDRPRLTVVGDRPGELDGMTVPQRMSIVTLGVADVAAATRFYESLGWRRAPGSQDAITFFEMQGSALGLFGHGDLADDAGVDAGGSGSDAATFRGVSISINVDSPSRRRRGVRRVGGLRGGRGDGRPGPCSGAGTSPTSRTPTGTCGRSPTTRTCRTTPTATSPSPTAEPRRSGMTNAGPPVASGAMSRRYLVRTFGCQMNEHDSERIAGLLEADGLVRADSEVDADVVVLNTCCIRENADNKLYGNLGHLKTWKGDKDGRQIVVSGCLAQKDQDRVAERAGYVDVVMGTHNVHRAAELLREAEHADRPITEILSEAVDRRPRDVPLGAARPAGDVVQRVGDHPDRLRQQLRVLHRPRGPWRGDEPPVRPGGRRGAGSSPNRASPR